MADVTSGADTLQALRRGELAGATTLRIPGGVVGNRFERLPTSLGDCRSLSQIGCRGSSVRDIPAESLPSALRWLTLTDNRIETLPESLVARFAAEADAGGESAEYPSGKPRFSK